MKQRFCPKCKSEDVSKPILNVFHARTGLDPGWRCNKCGLELQEFPMKEKIKKSNRKKK